ncbi:MAG: hypothetical protein IPL26_13815 [Leptospiraceae bacterium]|nr:hypothetical protein [Leptospiraceae bacterium]
MTINELKELLDGFLENWPLEKVKKMQLQDYVGLKNKDTFCQWVETKTRLLGSIKGLTSIKFGIYERRDSKKKPKNYFNDNKYSWLKNHGENREIAFRKVKENIVSIIKLSASGKFDMIDDITLPDLFKWKVAFLYSNERLIPIYKRTVLDKIAKHYGLKTTSKTKISEIQTLMIANKPANLNVYEFMQELYKKFGEKKELKVYEATTKKRINRKASQNKSITPQLRTVTRSYVAQQTHNKIQEALKNKLISKYGEKNVILEENFVDVKLIQPDFIGFYEVKSASYASECIKEALGQILLYSLNDNEKKVKKHFVVGQYPPTLKDQEYIDFIKKNLKLEFDYIPISIEFAE